MMTEFAPGKQLCCCTLLSRCGSGAYGEVWLARDEVGARVALKIVRNGGKFSEREIAGLRNYRDCSHPNLLRIRHIEITPEFLFYTMDAADDLNHGQGEYLPDTLANRLRQFTRLDGTEISEMLTGLLAGLSELHRHHLVHRDLKPDNILWVQGRPTLADAGLIAPAGAGSLVGTPGFLSPRLLSGKSCAEPEDDFFALGKVIYCALTGNPVEKYPSIPPELTLSGNADWNRLFREVCESPVASAEAFREKMQFSVQPHQRHAWRWAVIAVVLLLVAASFFFLPSRHKEIVSPAVEKIPSPHRTPEIQVSEIKKVPPSRRPPEIPTPEIKKVPSKSLPTPQTTVQSPAVASKQNDTKSPVLSALREAGLYDKEQMKALLDVPYFSRNDFFSRIEKCGNTPRMAGFPRYYANKKASPLERELIEICRDYQEVRLGELKERQFHWYRYSNGGITAQRRMLAEDPVMQMTALDHLLFEKIDHVLASGKLEEQDKELLSRWISLKKTLFSQKN